MSHYQGSRVHHGFGVDQNRLQFIVAERNLSHCFGYKAFECLYVGLPEPTIMWTLGWDEVPLDPLLSGISLAQGSTRADKVSAII